MSALGALTLDAVSKLFDETRAVDDVTLKIEPWQFVGIIGRSGAGKNTMLRLINRLIDPSMGSMSFGGFEITQLKGFALRDWRRDCAMIFQQFNLVEGLDLLRNVLIERLAEHGILSSMTMQFTDMESVMALQALDRLDLVP